MTGSSCRCHRDGRFTRRSEGTSFAKALWGSHCGKSARWVLSGGTGTRGHAHSVRAPARKSRIRRGSATGYRFKACPYPPDRPAALGGGQAPARLLARSPVRLRAGSDCTGGDAAGLSARLRSARRQYGRQHDAEGLPRSHRAPVRQGAADLAHGPRHPYRGGAGADAQERSASAVPGGYAQGDASPHSSARCWRSPGSRCGQRCA